MKQFYSSQLGFVEAFGENEKLLFRFCLTFVVCGFKNF